MRFWTRTGGGSLTVWPMLLAALLSLTGCAGMPVQPADVNQYLDETTGTTITTSTQPAVFAREAPMLAAFARDWVSIVPLEVNRLGRREYALYMDWWSTIDRGDRVGLDRPAVVVLMLDGEPMELMRTEFALDPAKIPRAADINGGKSVAYGVTGGQLRRFLAAGQRHVVADGRVFKPWQDEAGSFEALAAHMEVSRQRRLSSANE